MYYFVNPNPSVRKIDDGKVYSHIIFAGLKTENVGSVWVSSPATVAIESWEGSNGASINALCSSLHALDIEERLSKKQQQISLWKNNLQALREQDSSSVSVKDKTADLENKIKRGEDLIHHAQQYLNHLSVLWDYFPVARPQIEIKKDNVAESITTKKKKWESKKNRPSLGSLRGAEYLISTAEKEMSHAWSEVVLSSPSPSISDIVAHQTKQWWKDLEDKVEDKLEGEVFFDLMSDHSGGDAVVERRLENIKQKIEVVCTPSYIQYIEPVSRLTPSFKIEGEKWRQKTGLPWSDEERNEWAVVMSQTQMAYMTAGWLAGDHRVCSFIKEWCEVLTDKVYAHVSQSQEHINFKHTLPCFSPQRSSQPDASGRYAAYGYSSLNTSQLVAAVPSDIFDHKGEGVWKKKIHQQEEKAVLAGFAQQDIHDYLYDMTMVCLSVYMAMDKSIAHNNHMLAVRKPDRVKTISKYHMGSSYASPSWLFTELHGEIWDKYDRSYALRSARTTLWWDVVLETVFDRYPIEQYISSRLIHLSHGDVKKQAQISSCQNKIDAHHPTIKSDDVTSDSVTSDGIKKDDIFILPALSSVWRQKWGVGMDLQDLSVEAQKRYRYSRPRYIKQHEVIHMLNRRAEYLSLPSVKYYSGQLPPLRLMEKEMMENREGTIESDLTQWPQEIIEALEKMEDHQKKMYASVSNLDKGWLLLSHHGISRPAWLTGVTNLNWFSQLVQNSDFKKVAFNLEDYAEKILKSDRKYVAILDTMFFSVNGNFTSPTINGARFWPSVEALEKDLLLFLGPRQEKTIVVFGVDIKLNEQIVRKFTPQKVKTSEIDAEVFAETVLALQQKKIIYEGLLEKTELDEKNDIIRAQNEKISQLEERVLCLEQSQKPGSIGLSNDVGLSGCKSFNDKEGSNNKNVMDKELTHHEKVGEETDHNFGLSGEEKGLNMDQTVSSMPRKRKL